MKRWLLRLGVAFVALTVLPVACFRVVDPPTTAFMLAHRLDGKKVRQTWVPLERISPNLDAAARALGETAHSALWRIHLPLLAPALGAAGLLVFVDALKELPTTLLLRPFNFETLATHVYALAAVEQIESGALGALTIVLAGLVPLVVLHRTIAGGRAGGGS